MIRRILLRLKKSDHGTSMVEFAIVIPILLALIIGIIEFGWIFNGYITLTGAARDGARLAVAYNSNYDDSEIKEAIKSYAPLFDLTDSDIYIDRNEFGNEAVVRIDGELSLITGFFGGDNGGGSSIIRLPSLPSSYPLTAKVTMRQEQKE